MIDDKTPPAQVSDGEDHIGHNMSGMQPPNAACSIAQSSTMSVCKLHLVAASRSYLCPIRYWPPATCAGGILSSTNWCKYSTCIHGGHHLLQLVLVVDGCRTVGYHSGL